MALAQRTGRSRHRLILLALTAITLLTIDLNGFGPADGAQRLVRDMFNPVTTLVSNVFSPVGDAWNSLFNYGDLESENQALQQELDELRAAAIRGDADSAALQRLLEAAELPYVGDLEHVTAEIVRGSVGNFADHVITINKGAAHGIAENMAVVTGAGLVGKVEEVDNQTSTVRLLTDNSLSVGVRLVDTDGVGLASAVPGESGTLLVDRGLSYPTLGDEDLLPEVGTAVVTSSRSIFPADVPVGTIREVARGDDDVSLEVVVDAAADLASLQWVSILIVEPPDQVVLGEVTPNTIPGTDGLDPSLLDEEITSDGSGVDE